ncbi:Ig-like domain-containing protein [Chryseobacterium sp. Leaf394]|uniref:beta strand repeat-containing protein n=1 Tax=Chryseobacterium sp. Leaf394 TaxID=1736361 RepID=UPI0006F7E397|nr:Ig-like domain-containing protein [Chryseobacterium sp. Leaf394]KQS94185.1 hypothetical protein ASG21_18220 [Chryseobacterium sp. Leaf394]
MNFKNIFKKIAVLLPVAGFAFSSAQTVAATNTGTAVCFNCVPTNWTTVSGTPDKSNRTNASLNTGNNVGGGSLWTGAANGLGTPISLPLPPNGHTNWVSLRDLGTITTVQEVVSTNIGGLTGGRLYEVFFHSLSSVTNQGGNGSSSYAGKFIDQFSVQLGTGAAQNYTATQNTWQTQRARFTAASATVPIVFNALNNAVITGTTNPERFLNAETVQISVTANAVNAVPIAVADATQTFQNTPVNINIISNDSDFDGSVVAGSVDLNPSAPGLQTTFVLAGAGTFTVNSSGVVTFTPLPQFTGTATIPYTIQDNYILNTVITPSTSEPANISVEVISATDSDGDGIPNESDLDDDNDGILDTDEDICSKPNQIVNGDFSASPASTSWISNFSTNTPNTSGPLNYTGSALNIFVDNPGTLYPGNILLANTTPFTTSLGVAYSFSSTLNITGGTTNASFSWVLIDSSNSIVKVLQTYKTQTSGTGNVTITNTPTAYPVTFTAPGTGNYRLALTWITNSSSSGNAQDVRIDNVILLAPCDTDGDGIPNYLDLDSDNDGCPDAIEGSENVNTSQLNPNGSINIGLVAPNNGVGSSAANLGVPNLVNTGGAADSGSATAGTVGQPVGRSQDISRSDCLDSDGDGVPDWQDLDDDNDGILDTVECPPTNVFANFSPAVIATSGTTTTVSGITWGTITGTLNRELNGVTINTAIAKQTGDFSNSTVYTPAGTTSQGRLGEALTNFNATANYARYTLTLSVPVESITLHISDFDFMRTRFMGNHVEQLMSGGTELVYNTATRQLYDSDPNTFSTLARDGFGSVRITSTNGLPFTQIVFDRIDDPNTSQTIDGFSYTFSVQPACDTDGDGIPNYLDLDSDNDGCPDSREGAGNFNPTTLASGPIASQTPNTNFGTAVNTTTGIPTLVGAGQGVGQSQSSAQNDCLDSDGDTIPDWQDLDDDNDGILDTVECSNTIADLGNALTAGTAKDILPSDFGLALNAKNQNVTADLSAKFGYPPNSGAVVVSITNASVNPTANAWWTKQGQQPSIWRVTGTMSAFVLMAQDIQYYGNDSKTIHIYDSATVIPITFPGLVNQTAVANQWAVSESPTQKTLTDLDTNLTTIENGNWRFANMNFGPKTFGFSTTTPNADPAYAVLMYLECDADGDGIPNRLDLDSDGDGCSDAIEGAANIATTQLVAAGGTVTGGSTAVNQNLCATGACVNVSGIPQVSPLPTGYTNSEGQTVGDSQNALVNACVCYEDPALVAGATYPVKHGITLLGRAGAVNGNWPMLRNSAYTALESKTKGFVVTRNSSPETTIAIPVVGMMVFDSDENAGAGCLKIYTGPAAGEGWKCFNTQGCP